MQTEKREAQLVKSPDDVRCSYRIFVGCMVRTASRHDVFQTFRRFGTITEISSVYKPRHGPAFAFVEFAKQADARKAYAACQNNLHLSLHVAGSPVIVRPYKRSAKFAQYVTNSNSETQTGVSGESSPRAIKCRSKTSSNITKDDCGSEKALPDSSWKTSDHEEDDSIGNLDINFEAKVIDEVSSDAESAHSSGKRQCSAELPPTRCSGVSSSSPRHLKRYWADAFQGSVVSDWPSKQAAFSITSKATQTDKPSLEPIGAMWRPPSTTIVPPDCALLFSVEEDGAPWADVVLAELTSRGIRVEECLVESTDNATISAALSHIVPSWEPLFAIVLQAHNCAELSVNLVHFSQSGHLRQRGPMMAEYDLPLNAALSEMSVTVASARNSTEERRRILRHATYTMASSLGLRKGDSVRLSGELLAKRGERIANTFPRASLSSDED